MWRLVPRYRLGDGEALAVEGLELIKAEAHPNGIADRQDEPARKETAQPNRWGGLLARSCDLEADGDDNAVLVAFGSSQRSMIA